MGRIEDGGRARQNPPINHNVPRPQVQAEETPRTQVRANNAATRRADVQNYADQRRIQLNNQVDERENNSVLIGGVAGSTAAQFEVREQQIRETTPIKIRSNAATPPDFVNQVEANLNRLAPGTTIERPPTDPHQRQLWNQMHGSDVAGIVRLSTNRVSGHDQGYRLLDQLSSRPALDNQNRPIVGQQANDANRVFIEYDPNPSRARAVPRDWNNITQNNRQVASSNGFGTALNPGNGVGSTVFYNPTTPLDLPVVQQNGTIARQPADPAIILGHELAHASHAQRGTLDPRLGTEGNDHFFRENRQSYREGNFQGSFLAEEFRTVGFNGSRLGSEPTENSLRSELGIREPRASYLENGNYPGGVSGYNPISSSDAFWGRAGQTVRNTATSTVDGVRGSRNSAMIGGGFSAAVSLANGNDARTVLNDAAIGAGSGVADEVIQRVVNGPASTTSGMTNNAFRTAASQIRGASVAGAVLNTGFAVHDQWNNLQNDATRSAAVGTIAGEAVVGAASGAAGAYAGAMAGAAIGSIVPGVGTVIGGIVGFAAGAAVGYLVDRGLRGLGVNQLVASGVTAAYNGLSNLAGQATQAVGNVAEGARNLMSGAASRLSSIFG